MKFMLILKLNKEITIHKSNNLSDLTSKRLYLFYFFLAQTKKTQQKLQEKRCHRGGREEERERERGGGRGREEGEGEIHG